MCIVLQWISFDFFIFKLLVGPEISKPFAILGNRTSPVCSQMHSPILCTSPFNFKIKTVFSDQIPSPFLYSKWLNIDGRPRLQRFCRFNWLVMSVNIPIIGCLANLHSIAFKFALNDKITMPFKRKEHATVWCWKAFLLLVAVPLTHQG